MLPRKALGCPCTARGTVDGCSSLDSVSDPPAVRMSPVLHPHTQPCFISSPAPRKQRGTGCCRGPREANPAISTKFSIQRRASCSPPVGSALPRGAGAPQVPLAASCTWLWGGKDHEQGIAKVGNTGPTASLGGCAGYRGQSSSIPGGGAAALAWGRSPSSS